MNTARSTRWNRRWCDIPYIDQDIRDWLDSTDVPQAMPKKGGELNYVITLKIIEYVGVRGLNYETIEQVRAALYGALTEFDRRVAFPYEDRAILRNGDVYPEELVGLPTG